MVKKINEKDKSSQKNGPAKSKKPAAGPRDKSATAVKPAAASKSPAAAAMWAAAEKQSRNKAADAHSDAFKAKHSSKKAAPLKERGTKEEYEEKRFPKAKIAEAVEEVTDEKLQ